MKLTKLIFIAAFLALFVFACGQNAVTNTGTNNRAANSPDTEPSIMRTPPDEHEAAKAVYADKCAKCHKDNGTGGEVDVLGEKRNAANFTSEKLKKDPDAEFIEAITDGIADEGMPSFKGKLTDEQIKSLVKFIRKEFQGK